MSYEIVHTFGSTIYFVFFLLFLWVSRVPRTNPGAGWWAIAIACALLSRLSLVLLLPSTDTRVAITVYAAWNILEKSFLLTGLARFLAQDSRIRWYWLATVAAELWLLMAWGAEFDFMTRNIGYSIVNGGFSLYLAWALFQRRHDVPNRLLLATSISSLALGLHWLSAPLLIYYFPSWFKNGYILGTMLVLVQYLSLLAAILSLLQQRLLDAESKALDMAFQDPLTGLNNQRYMNTLFDHALLLATRPHHIVAVFYIDLDNFKPINDSAGHAVGDQVLKTVASRLKDSTRSTDICARVGGDEFVVIGTQLDNGAQAYEVARKLLAQLTRGIEVNDVNYQLGASIGISLYPLHGDNLTQLIHRADSAMYRVKRNGKSGYEIYDANDPHAASAAKWMAPQPSQS